MTLNDNTWAELCFVKDGRQNGWGDVSQETEIYFIWHGGARVDEHREVCFFYGHNEESWYHSYQSINSSWPMDTAKITPKTQFNYLFDYNRFYQSENNAQTEFALILEHLFVNSDGFAVLLDQYAPWFIRRHSNEDNPVMCFSADSHYPYAVDNHDASYRDIKIRLFSSTNIRTVLDYVVHKSGHIPNATKVPHEKMFKYPFWPTLSLVEQTEHREAQVATFVNELTRHNLSMQSELLFDDYWAQSSGEFSFNTKILRQFSLLNYKIIN